jgi:hypothetical protein
MPCWRNKMFNLIFERSFREFLYSSEFSNVYFDLLPFRYYWNVIIVSRLLIFVLLSTFEARLACRSLVWAMRFLGDHISGHLTIPHKILTQIFDSNRFATLDLLNAVLCPIESCIVDNALVDSYKHSSDSSVFGLEIGLETFQGLDWVWLCKIVCRPEASCNCLVGLFGSLHEIY